MARSNLSVAVSSRARRILLEEQRAVGNSAEDVPGELLGKVNLCPDIPHVGPYIL